MCKQYFVTDIRRLAKLPRSRARLRRGSKGRFRAVRAAVQRQRARARAANDESEKLSAAAVRVASPRQLQVVSVGLMGLGKSTMLRALAHVLGGEWVNQDEFSNLQRQAKPAFLAKIRSAASSRPAVLVDKINILQSHRTEALRELGEGAASGGKEAVRVLLRFLHPEDPPDRLGQKAVKLALDRITARGSGHRTLVGSNPQLENILTCAARDFEVPSQQELKQFDAVLSVDVTRSSKESLQKVLESLQHQGLLPMVHATPTIDIALAAASEHEATLREGGKPKSGLTGALPLQESKKEMQESQVAMGDSAQLLPLWWGVMLDSPDVLDKMRFEVPVYFRRASDLHVTLLFAGGGHSDHAAAKRAGLMPEAFTKMRLECERLCGREVKLEPVRLVQDADGACIQVALPDGIPCASRHPHVTLAHSAQVGPVYSNALLAKAAELTSGQPGILVRDLGPAPACLKGTIRACWPKGVPKPSRFKKDMPASQRSRCTSWRPVPQGKTKQAAKWGKAQTTRR